MSARRHLVSRPDLTSGASAARQTATLPPYEPPSCPLTASGKRALENLTSSHDYKKYKKHLDAAITNVTDCAAEGNDLLHTRKQQLKRLEAKKQARADAGEDEGPTENEERLMRSAEELEMKVARLTTNAERAMRDLIDYQGELEQQEAIIKRVGDDIASAAPDARNTANRAGRRQRNPAADDEDDEDYNESDETNVDSEDVASHADILSPTELLLKAKEKYTRTYQAKSMRARYAESNNYKGFKRVVHDALNPGDDAPPVPHASTWFPEEGSGADKTPAARRRRLASSTDNAYNRNEILEDDDIMITSEIASLKCPLTLQTFTEPYSNNVCKHTFEKSAILAYHHENAVAFIDPSLSGRRARNQPLGPKQLKCPATGCDAMIELKDFYDDALLLRKVKRAAMLAAADMEDDDEEERNEPPPGTQRRRPEEIEDTDGDGFADIDNEERRKTITKIKYERPGRGHSQGRALEEGGDEVDEDEKDE